jgi:hypothetical protein
LRAIARQLPDKKILPEAAKIAEGDQMVSLAHEKARIFGAVKRKTMRAFKSDS